MNPNMPIKSRTRRNNIRTQVEQDGQSLQMPINHHHQQQSYIKVTEHEQQRIQQHQHQQHYRLMEQQQHHQNDATTPDQPFVLDLSLKSKNTSNSISNNNFNNHDDNDDVETTRSMSDDDVKMMKNQSLHPLQSLLSLSGINKPMYTSNEMTMFWNMLMHFSFNNYNNYMSQFKDNISSSNNNNISSGIVDVLKGRY
jgi:hypothetical protein